MKLLTSTMTLFLSILLISTPTHAGVLSDLYDDIGKAEMEEGPFVNSYQLEKILNVLGAKKIDENNGPSVLYYDKIQHGTVNGIPGYARGLTAQIRAYGKTIGPKYSSETIIYRLPATFHFPNDPKKNPLRISVHTVKIIPEVADKMLAESSVNIIFKELNGEKDWTIVYGQTVLEDTKTTVKLDVDSLLITSEIDISNMDTEDALDYFSSFQDKISGFNAAVATKRQDLKEAWNEEQEAVREQEYEYQEQEQEVLFNKTWTSIPDSNTFELLASQAHKSRLIDNPISKLGHWEYDYKDDNLSIEVINYGTYFEKSYLIETRDSVSKEQKEKMYAELKKLAENKSPIGASSIDVGESRYEGFTKITVTYAFGKSFKGRDVYEYTKGFDDFVSELHLDAKEIRDKYAQLITDKEFTTVSKEEFMELIDDGLEGLKDFGKDAKGYWIYYNSRKNLAGVGFQVANYSDHMLLSMTYEFSQAWPVETVSETYPRFKDWLDDAEILGADKFELVTIDDNPRDFWIKFTINYEQKSMFSSSGTKGSTIKENYDAFTKTTAAELKTKLKAIAQEVYDEQH